MSASAEKGTWSVHPWSDVVVLEKESYLMYKKLGQNNVFIENNELYRTYLPKPRLWELANLACTRMWVVSKRKIELVFRKLSMSVTYHSSAKDKEI